MKLTKDLIPSALRLFCAFGSLQACSSKHSRSLRTRFPVKYYLQRGLPTVLLQKMWPIRDAPEDYGVEVNSEF